MSSTILIAAAGTAIAALPLLVSRKSSLINPALLMFAVVAWSLLLETLYIAILRPAPNASGVDLIYIRAASSDFFFDGALLVFVGVCGYVAGFFLPGRRTFRTTFPHTTRRPPAARRSYGVATLLLLLAGVCFAMYLITSGTSLTGGPLIAKRFRSTDIGLASRFLYLPYYFFKLALTSGSVTYAAGLLLFCATTRREERGGKLLFTLLFIFTLALSHFASLRLVILLLVLQVLLLTVYLRERRHALFIGIFALLTFASFGWITLIARPAPPPPLAAVAEIPASPPPVSPPRTGSEARTEASVPERAEPPAVDSSGGPARPIVRQSRLPMEQRLRGALASAFDGRYLMDVAKVAQIAHHFPDAAPFLWGEGLLGRAPASAPDMKPADGTLNRYLSRAVFGEPNNNIGPGFLGDLYVNFGYVAVLTGFLVLGGFHRLLFNSLMAPGLPVLVAGCLIALIPSTTLVLLDVGIVSAASRSALDIAAVLLVWWPWSRRLTAGGEPGRATSAGSTP